MSLLAIAAATLASPHAAILTCGGSVFRTESRSWADTAAPSAPVRQSIAVTATDARRRTVPLEPAPVAVVDGYRVRGAYLSSWACVRATTGNRYVVLGYACAVEPGRAGDCGGDAEWFRLLDLRGRRLDLQVPRNGPAADALWRRLGLASAFEQGVTMTDVLGH